MGVSWVPGKGQLIEIRLPPDAALPANAATTAGRVEAKVLLQGLDRPSGLVRGRDGRIYVGEAGRIWRATVPPLGQAPTPEVLLDGLPSDGAHPLKELAVAPDAPDSHAQTLYVNMGSVTDACRGDDQRQPVPCPERSAFKGKPRGAVWKLTLADGKTGTAAVQRFEPFAVGLRNSVALAVLPDGPAAGSVWQGENGIDYTSPKEPPEELNRLREGADHGWPYCVGNRQAARGYEKRFDCAITQAPHMLWPAHVAPLQLLATPADSPFKGQLLVAWHGPGAGGQRVVGFARDAQGLPGGKPIDWLGGWGELKGQRPRGRPTGLALDHADRLLVVEDFNRTLLMLMRTDGKSK
jgi:glucose/arabinose dehydrogenase